MAGPAMLAEAGTTGGVHLIGFWARRARRLLPALFLVIAFVGLYAVLVAQPSELQRIRDDAFATLLYVANWRFIFGGFDYFALFNSPSPLNHTWSLAIEEQFYLLWPLVFVATLAWGRRRDRDAALDHARRRGRADRDHARQHGRLRTGDLRRVARHRPSGRRPALGATTAGHPTIDGGGELGRLLPRG